MKVELKDVLHFYVGCRIVYSDEPQNQNHKLTLEVLAKKMFGHSIKPILRPLSDMTELESNYLACIFPMPNNHNWNREKWNMQEFLYLLKQGFDLFGLIESEQAFDKTKVK